MEEERTVIETSININNKEYKYAISIDEDNRILSATFPQYAGPNSILVENLPEGDITDYLYIDGEYVYSPIVDSISASDKRKLAYENDTIILYKEEMITVDKAVELWYRYTAEGDTEKSSELTILIHQAKTQIRELYPDEIENESEAQ